MSIYKLTLIVITLLCGCRGNDPKNELMLAIAAGDPNQVRTLLQKNPDLAHCKFERPDQRKFIRPLHLAASVGPEVLRAVIEGGGDLNNDLDGFGFTVLHSLLFYTDGPHIKKEIDALKVILESRPDLELRGKDLSQHNVTITVLCEAARFELLEQVELLLKHGADPNNGDSNDMKPLEYAANCQRFSENRVKIIRLLAKSGADDILSRRNSNTTCDQQYIKAFQEGRRTYPSGASD